MKKVKYLVHPDHKIQGDKSTTFITAEELMELHGVDPEECAIAQYDPERDNLFKRTGRGTILGGVLNLYVKEDGFYGDYDG